MIEIDGSRYSGSGAIVRQAAAFAALTGTPLHVVRARARRSRPGLRPQHVRAVEAIAELVGGRTEGVEIGAREFMMHPGATRPSGYYMWDIGTAGSTTALALALVPVLTFGDGATEIELRGGVFQDFAPSAFHLQHVFFPLLGSMGVTASAELVRPGYVPTGTGILRLQVSPVEGPLKPLSLERAGAVRRVWGIALASRLRERRVAERMGAGARQALWQAGYDAQIEAQEDDSADQAGAALALFADLEGGQRLGSDRAGAPRRRAEAIGRHAARQLLDDLGTDAAVDRFTADQLIPFMALAGGESRVRIPRVTEHVESAGWLAREFFGADVRVEEGLLTVRGAGFTRGVDQPSARGG